MRGSYLDCLDLCVQWGQELHFRGYTAPPEAVVGERTALFETLQVRHDHKIGNRRLKGVRRENQRERTHMQRYMDGYYEGDVSPRPDDPSHRLHVIAETVEGDQPVSEADVGVPTLFQEGGDVPLCLEYHGVPGEGCEVSK